MEQGYNRNARQIVEYSRVAQYQDGRRYEWDNDKEMWVNTKYVAKICRCNIAIQWIK